MGLGPLELSGGISRMTDFANIKHNEDHKGIVDQANFSGQFDKEIQERANAVNKGAGITNDSEKKFDAKDKGSNEYHGDGGRHRNPEKKENGDGVVVTKEKTSTFDIRI
ncbi:MAG: hypothetical protein IK121_09020 [Lachnospiraceae bacterium]|jgi:hypothetical protein|nr:hypothetical protein [Lachnospiraceae bacterium]MBP5600645.1 hypothetical protein [Lachnospiraceae bacterium]MBR5357044.1 hypothetical protein [Lachnospiraceae bacterium]